MEIFLDSRDEEIRFEWVFCSFSSFIWGYGDVGTRGYGDVGTCNKYRL